MEPQNPVPLTDVRKAFHEEFFETGSKFAMNMLGLLPELEAIAIVPSWSPRQEHIPPGIIAGRNGTISGASEVYHMAEQLHAVLHQVMKQSRTVLTHYDEQLGEIAREIRERTAELEQLNASIAAAKSQRGAAGGAAAEPAGSDAD